MGADKSGFAGAQKVVHNILGANRAFFVSKLSELVTLDKFLLALLRIRIDCVVTANPGAGYQALWAIGRNKRN